MVGAQPALRFLTYFMLMSLLRVHDGMPTSAPSRWHGGGAPASETWAGPLIHLAKPATGVEDAWVPRETFPVAAMIVAAVHTFPQVASPPIAAISVGWKPDFAAFGYGGLGLLLLMVFSAALGLLFSALTVMCWRSPKYRHDLDAVHALLVPMIYPFSMIYRLRIDHPVMWREIYLANPVTQAVLMFQRLFWFPTIENADTKMPWCGHLKANPEAFANCEIPVEFPPDMLVRALITLALSFVLLWLAQRIFKKFETKFPERL
ncbi:MAG: hypothetical protein R2693_10905 [Nocardioidaceae bacterium]